MLYAIGKYVSEKWKLKWIETWNYKGTRKCNMTLLYKMVQYPGLVLNCNNQHPFLQFYHFWYVEVAHILCVSAQSFPFSDRYITKKNHGQFHATFKINYLWTSKNIWQTSRWIPYKFAKYLFYDQLKARTCLLLTCVILVHNPTRYSSTLFGVVLHFYNCCLSGHFASESEPNLCILMISVKYIIW